ncbi:MAG: hypothetical protein ABR985_20220 [Methanotrichaceae archaeon]
MRAALALGKWPPDELTMPSPQASSRPDWLPKRPSVTPDASWGRLARKDIPA